MPKRVTGLIWIVTVLDMMNAAWMIAAGSWLDKTGGIAAALTLGGHYELVLIMAAVGFPMLVGLAVLTKAFKWVGRLELALIAIACAVSIVAQAIAVSAVLLLLVGAVLLLTGALQLGGIAGRLLVGTESERLR